MVCFGFCKHVGNKYDYHFLLYKDNKKYVVRLFVRRESLSVF